jgi:hypothetical protein
MSTRLRNRRAIENKLGAFVEAMSVTEDMVAGIIEAEVGALGRWRAFRGRGPLPRGADCCRRAEAARRMRAPPRLLPHRPRIRPHPGPRPCPSPTPQVNEDYLEHLLALDRKIKFLGADDTARGSQCRRDVEVVLEKLRIKAVTKVGPRALVSHPAGTGPHHASAAGRPARRRTCLPLQTSTRRPRPAARVPPRAPLPAAQAQDQHLYHPAECAAPVQVLCALRAGARGGRVPGGGRQRGAGGGAREGKGAGARPASRGRVGMPAPGAAAGRRPCWGQPDKHAHAAHRAAPRPLLKLRTEYATVVGRVLAAHFRTYLSAMEKMAAPVAGQGDVLGVPPEASTSGGGLAGQFGGGVMSAMSGAMGLFAKAQGRVTTVGGQSDHGAAGRPGQGRQGAGVASSAPAVPPELPQLPSVQGCTDRRPTPMPLPNRSTPLSWATAPRCCPRWTRPPSFPTSPRWRAGSSPTRCAVRSARREQRPGDAPLRQGHQPAFAHPPVHPPAHPPRAPGHLSQRAQAAGGHRVQRVPVLPRLLGGRAAVPRAHGAHRGGGGGRPRGAAAGARLGPACPCGRGARLHVGQRGSSSTAAGWRGEQRAHLSLLSTHHLHTRATGRATGPVGRGGRAADDPHQRGAAAPHEPPPRALPRRLPGPRQPAAVAALQGAWGRGRGGRGQRGPIKALHCPARPAPCHAVRASPLDGRANLTCPLPFPLLPQRFCGTCSTPALRLAQSAPCSPGRSRSARRPSATRP